MSGVKSQQQEDDKKPSDVQSGGLINLKVVGQDGTGLSVWIKRSTQLKKLMLAYCERKSVEFNSIRFLYDGSRLVEHNTPEQLEMEDGAEISVMTEQHGGA